MLYFFIASRRGVGVNAVNFQIASVLAKFRLHGMQAPRYWFGAKKESAMNTIRKPASREDSSLSLGPIGQISRTVSDIEQSVQWYRDVLGLPHLYTFGTLAFFDCGGTRLYLSQEGEVSKSESILYLRVDDIVSAHKTLEERGVEFTSAPHPIHKHADGTEEWMAFFNDPDGRPLGLMSQVGA